jgi:hypothetical protein
VVVVGTWRPEDPPKRTPRAAVDLHLPPLDPSPKTRTVPKDSTPAIKEKPAEHRPRDPAGGDPQLARLMRQLEDAKTAERAARELAELGDHAATPALIRALENGANVKTRVAAAEALGLLGDASALSPLGPFEARSRTGRGTSGLPAHVSCG